MAHALTDRFAEAVDWRNGTIRGEGRLTVQGADLICGVAEQLHRRGHARVTVDLLAVRIADEAAVDLLRALAAELRADAGELVVVVPGGDAQPTTTSASNSAPNGRAATATAVRAGYGSVKNSR